MGTAGFETQGAHHSDLQRPGRIRPTVVQLRAVVGSPRRGRNDAARL